MNRGLRGLQQDADDSRRPLPPRPRQAQRSLRERLTSATPTTGGGWVIYVDGASRGNPGPAGFGVVIYGPDGKERHHLSRYLGRQTNNFAEWSAAIAGVKAAMRLGAQRVILKSDSELVIRQLRGEYKVKDAKLRLLFEQMRDLVQALDSFEAVHVPRGTNTKADVLANLVLE